MLWRAILNCCIFDTANMIFLFLFFFKEKCILTYNATGTTGMYAVALQIEDFATEQALNALSSIPIQFLINVTVHNSTESCSIKPVFENLHELNSVVEIPVHITYYQTIIAKGFR